MNDTMGLIYDNDAAVRFAAVHAGLTEADCATILAARDRYLVGLGIINLGDDTIDGVSTPADIRAEAPALFPAQVGAVGLVDPAKERAFIVLRTNIDPETVRRVQDADFEYMRRRGIVD